MSALHVIQDESVIRRHVIDSVQGPKYRWIANESFKVAPTFDQAEPGLGYKPNEDDLFIVTYPKNGTTWTQQIVTLIQCNGSFPEGKKKDNFSKFLEMDGIEKVEARIRPGSIKTHLPFELQPKIGSPPNFGPKFIFVIRNAKDAAVSFHYHHQLFDAYGVQGMDFHDFFKFWIRGELECGSYFDFVKGWWNQRNNPNVLTLLYEDMKSDTRSAIIKIADFMGSDYKSKMLEDDERVLKLVTQNSSFDTMKRERSSDDDKEFIRKGIIGDHVNHLNEEENEQIERLFHEKFDGTGLEHLWDNYHIFN